MLENKEVKTVSLSKNCEKRIIAFIVIIGIICMMLFSAWYLSKHGEHRHGGTDCSGQSCSICIQLKQADYTLRQLTQLLVYFCQSSVLLLLFICLRFMTDNAISIRHDLVAMKIRMDD